MSFIDIAETINRKANEYEIGNFYKIRKSIDPKQMMYRHGLFRISPSHSSDDWGYAFHYGGRKEMQFNIGNEEDDNLNLFRYGVAFSLEIDRNFQDITPLLRKIQIFNEYLASHEYEFLDYSLWAYRKGLEIQKIDGLIIPVEKQKTGWFIFFGKKCKIEHIDYDAVLLDLCHLLKIYIFIEQTNSYSTSSNLGDHSRGQKDDRKQTLTWTQASYVQQQIIVYLRHNELQQCLVRKLRKIYKPENVIMEHECANNCRIDVLVRVDDAVEIYEIKTDHSARLCIRSAIGQLLEYSRWTGASNARKIIVVGEKSLDKQSSDYLEVLNKNFPAEISYEQVDLDYNE